MNIIFTASYLSMRETFDIILDNENDFLIVTPNEKSYNFFKLLYNENKVYFTSKVFKASFFINFLSTVLKLISQFLKLCFFYSESMRLIINIISEIIPTYIKKKNIWDYFKDLKNNNVFFWETGYCYFEDWLIYKLSKTNKVIYIQYGSNSFKDSNLLINNIKTKEKLIYSIAAKLKKSIYMADYKLAVNCNHLAFLLTPEYYLGFSKNIYNITKKSDEQITEKIIDKIPIMKNKSILWLGISTFKNDFDKDEYIYLIQDIFSRIDMKNIVIKTHPNDNRKYGMENELDEIPNYIPADLISQEFKYVIGTCSVALSNAANNGAFSISIVNLISSFKIKSKELLMREMKIFLEKDKNIYFPNTIEDLQKLFDRNLFINNI